MACTLRLYIHVHLGGTVAAPLVSLVVMYGVPNALTFETTGW